MDSQVMELTLFNEERRFPKPNSNDNNNNSSRNSNNNNNQHNNDDANNYLESDLSQIQRQCNTLEPPEKYKYIQIHVRLFLKVHTWSALGTFELMLTCLVCRLAKKIVNITILKKETPLFEWIFQK